MELANLVRDVPDFPVPGILFKDITTLVRDPAAFREVISRLTDHYADKPIDVVAAIESRGFIFGAPLAWKLGAGFVPVRKPGKLPSKTIRATYSLEYGTDSLEIHSDAVERGQRVLIVDDLLATGGTARATANLVRELGGNVLAIAFLIELAELNGRARLTDEALHVVLTY